MAGSVVSWRRALGELSAFDARQASQDGQQTRDRAQLVAQARKALWNFVVQRESCGLRDARQVIIDYRVPPEVQQAVAVPPLPRRVHKVGCAYPAHSCASTTATAVMLTTPRAVTDGERICAGFAVPIRIGPTGKRVRDRLDHLESDVGGIEIRHDQHVGLPVQARMRKHAFAQQRVERGVAVHLAVDLKFRMARRQQCIGRAHLARRRRVIAAEIRMRQQRDLWLQSEAAHMHRGQRCHFRDFRRRRIGPHFGVAEENMRPWT